MRGTLRIAEVQVARASVQASSAAGLTAIVNRDEETGDVPGAR